MTSTNAFTPIVSSNTINTIATNPGNLICLTNSAQSLYVDTSAGRKLIATNDTDLRETITAQTTFTPSDSTETPSLLGTAAPFLTSTSYLETTDMDADLAKMKSWAGRIHDNWNNQDIWYNGISIRPHNGEGDIGKNYGFRIVTRQDKQSHLTWKKQVGGVWGTGRNILDNQLIQESDAAFTWGGKNTFDASIFARVMGDYKSLSGTQGSAGYINVLTVKVPDGYTYLDKPIRFSISRRRSAPYDCYMYFSTSNSGKTHTLSAAKCLTAKSTDTVPIWIVNSDTNTFKIWVQKIESYDRISINLSYDHSFMEGLSLNFDNTQQSSAPGGTQITGAM